MAVGKEEGRNKDASWTICCLDRSVALPSTQDQRINKKSCACLEMRYLPAEQILFEEFAGAPPSPLMYRKSAGREIRSVPYPHCVNCVPASSIDICQRMRE